MTDQERQAHLRMLSTQQQQYLLRQRGRFRPTPPKSFNPMTQFKKSGGCASGKCGMRKPNSEISDSSKNLNDGS